MIFVANLKMPNSVKLNFFRHPVSNEYLFCLDLQSVKYFVSGTECSFEAGIMSRYIEIIDFKGSKYHDNGGVVIKM